MTRRRFYAPPDEIRDSIIALSGEETHHLTHVLRMAPGDPAFVFDGCGREYRCHFRGLKDDRAQLEVGERLSDVVESPVGITLAQALAKGEKFDFIVQKVTELGVSRIVPLVTRYADARLDDQQTARRIQRWRRISLEAVKQCGRRKLVEIAPPRTLPQLLDSVTHSASDNVAHTATDKLAQAGDHNVAHAANHNVAHAASLRTESEETTIRNLAAFATSTDPVLLLFSERGGVAITDAIADWSNPHAVVALVGPEGGWSDDELVLLNEAGSKAVTLGPRVLRTETAALVAITLIQHAIGDLSTGGTE